jgi:hypothetical protein
MIVRGLMKFEGPGMISFVSLHPNPISAGH